MKPWGSLKFKTHSLWSETTIKYQLYACKPLASQSMIHIKHFFNFKLKTSLFIF